MTTLPAQSDRETRVRSSRRYVIAANGIDTPKPWAVVDIWDSRARISLHKTLDLADRKANNLNRQHRQKQFRGAL